MVGFLERLKKFKEDQKEKRILKQAGRGVELDRRRRLRAIQLEEKVERQTRQLTQQSKLRAEQLKRARLEAQILKQKTKAQASRKKLAGPVRQTLGTVKRAVQETQSGFQSANIGATLMDFGPRVAPQITRQVRKKPRKKPPRPQIIVPQRKPVIGGGRFRVL